MIKYYIYKVITDGKVSYVGTVTSFEDILTSQNQYCFKSGNFVLEYLEVCGEAPKNCLELYFVNLYKPYYNRERKFKKKFKLMVQELNNLNWDTYIGPIMKKNHKFSCEPAIGYASRDNKTECFTYKLINTSDNQVIYVGSTTTPLDLRINAHKNKFRGINFQCYYIVFDSIADASFCEIYFINRFHCNENTRSLSNDGSIFVLGEMDRMIWNEYIKADYLLKYPHPKNQRYKPPLIVRPLNPR